MRALRKHGALPEVRQWALGLIANLSSGDADCKQAVAEGANPNPNPNPHANPNPNPNPSPNPDPDQRAAARERAESLAYSAAYALPPKGAAPRRGEERSARARAEAAGVGAKAWGGEGKSEGKARAGGAPKGTRRASPKAKPER